MERCLYLLNGVDYELLRSVMKRLYDDRPLDGDSRRDLANLLFAILDRTTPTED